LTTKKGNTNVNNVDCKAVESEMTAKLDSALGGMQAEINALKSNAPALILSSNSPLSALPLPIGQFAGTQVCHRKPHCNSLQLCLLEIRKCWKQ